VPIHRGEARVTRVPHTTVAERFIKCLEAMLDGGRPGLVSLSENPVDELSEGLIPSSPFFDAPLVNTGIGFRKSRDLPLPSRQKCSVRQVNMTISMAFIASALVKAAVEGRLPRGIGVATLRDAPAEWSLQFERLGLAQP